MNVDPQIRTRDSGRVPLALSPAEFRALGHDLVDRVAAILESIPDRPVMPAVTPHELPALLGDDAPIPEEGAAPGPLLEEAARLLLENSTFNAHPRFFGYITAGPAPIGILGDFLAAAINPNVGGWMLAPMATEIEAQTVRWIAQLIGFPDDGGGLLVSGGNMANFTCFLAARTAMAGQVVRDGGLAALPPVAVYASGETHTWIHKAADLFGIGTNAIRWIPTDARQRMRTDALRDAIRHDLDAGVRPLLAVGTAGSVSTGAIDPLRDIAHLCREHGLWFHIDGAYGGIAAAVGDIVEEAAPLLDIGLADSIAVDPHKWLYAPLEAGCALVRDAAALRNAFAYHPPYYHFRVEALNYVDHGPQNSRGFRALKVWLALRHAGRQGYRRMIADDIALARRLFRAVSEHPELEPVGCDLSITTFRYVPPELRPHVGEEGTEKELNRINELLLDALQREGNVFVSNAVVDGRYVLRACIVNFNTCAEDVDAVPGLVVERGRELVERGH